MLGIKDLRTGSIVEQIDGKCAFITMIDGDLNIVKLLNWNTSVIVPRGIDYEIVVL